MVANDLFDNGLFDSPVKLLKQFTNGRAVPLIRNQQVRLTVTFHQAVAIRLVVAPRRTIAGAGWLRLARAWREGGGGFARRAATNIRAGVVYRSAGIFFRAYRGIPRRAGA